MACRKDQPVKWSAVAKSGDADITITQCEAYGLADFGHEYEEIPTSGMTSHSPNPEYEIPTAQCPAYRPTSQQKERVEEFPVEYLPVSHPEYMDSASALNMVQSIFKIGF